MATETMYTAFIAMQKEVANVPLIKDAKAQYGKYLSLANLISAVLPVMNKHGFGLVQLPAVLDNGEPGLRTEIIYKDGQSISSLMPLMLKSSDPQGQGSAITYAKRYALAAALGVVADEDDDGNKAQELAQKPNKTKEAYIKNINSLLGRLGRNEGVVNDKPLTSYSETELVKIGRVLAAQVEES